VAYPLDGMSTPLHRALALLGASVLAASLVGCANKVSTSGFSGEEREVAQTISNLQANATAANEQKICSNDLAGGVVARLNAAPGGCRQAVKSQVTEVDSLNMTVQSVQLSGTGAQRTASARVKSVYEGKLRPSTVSLVKEGGKWKISGVS
jgi:hypothetical protein